MSQPGANPTGQRLTIREIASLSGVSIATVSRVLNDHPDVSPSTREKVLRHVREHAYVTNRSAHSRSGARTGLIGLISPYLSADYFSQIMAGAAEALFARDARLVVCPTYHQPVRETSLLSRLMHGTTDGALLILPSESKEELVVAREQGFPIVVIDPFLEVGDRIPVVSTANLAGARSITEHLIELGHERIGVITGQKDGFASQHRLDGYRLALAKADLPFSSDLIYDHDTEFRFGDGVEGARHLLSLPNPPTAIFALNDAMAVGVLHAARDRGLEVPGDLSVAGFDDVELAQVAIPALTTVRQPLQELGRVAVDLLYRLIDGHSLDETRVELSTELVVRNSTLSPPTS